MPHRPHPLPRPRPHPPRPRAAPRAAPSNNTHATGLEDEQRGVRRDWDKRREGSRDRGSRTLSVLEPLVRFLYIYFVYFCTNSLQRGPRRISGPLILFFLDSSIVACHPTTKIGVRDVLRSKRSHKLRLDPWWVFFFNFCIYLIPTNFLRGI